MSASASRMRTPSRRQTFAPVTSKEKNRRMTMDAASGAAPRGGPSGGNSAVAGSLSATTNKPRPMNSRASMIPRVGRENLIPPTPKAPPTTTAGDGGGGLSTNGSSSNYTSTAAASSRRRTMGGGGGHYTHGSEKRRQSVLPPTPATAKDPRPLHDKNYQLQCSKKLLNFLVENGYDHQIISLKTLKMPSRKDFISIVTFMLRLIDPTFQDGTMKLEEEISMYFRSLGYPFPISKTSLAAAGATHTWPALLGALVWLMETLQHNTSPEKDQQAASSEDETETVESLEELEKKTDRTFFDYLGQAYMAFLREDDTRSEMLEKQLNDEFEADNNLLAEEIERVSDMNSTIVEQITNLEKQFIELPAYDKKRNDYATDLEQFHDLIRQMDEHKKALQHKVQERTAELAEKNTELRQLSDEKEALKQTIATQVLSIDDLPKLENAQKQADEAFVRTTHSKDRLKSIISEYQEKLDTSVACLEQNMTDYNQLITELATTNPRFIDFANMKTSNHLNKDKLHSTQDELLGVDLYETVHPLISRCQRVLSDKTGETKAELQEHLDTVDNVEAANKENAAKLKILFEKLSRCEGILLQQTESLESVLAVRQREVAAMEQKVQSIQEPPGTVEEQVAVLERECATLEALRLQRQEEHAVRKKTVRTKIEHALNLMLQQEEYTQRRLAQLCDYWGNKRAVALVAIQKHDEKPSANNLTDNNH